MKESIKKLYGKQIIYGDIVSKSNNYRIVTISGHASLTKTSMAKEYEKKFMLQCSLRNANIKGFFALKVKAFFGSNRKDLDGCLKILLDCLQQCKAIANDRNCVRIEAEKFVDKERPRVEFEIIEI